MVLNYVYVSSEAAAEPDTQNIRSPKKTPKGTLFQRQKDRYYLQSMWEGNAKWDRNYVYVSYGISC